MLDLNKNGFDTDFYLKMKGKVNEYFTNSTLFKEKPTSIINYIDY
jgi:hypothetical protein